MIVAGEHPGRWHVGGNSSRRRRVRRTSPDGAEPARTRPAWRETFHSYGGFLTLGVIVAAVAVIVLLVVRNPIGFSVSGDDLLGEEVQIASASHVGSERDMVIPIGAPPAGGPHFNRPLTTGFYDDPVPDGNAVHSLEHGIVWISYNPELLDQAGLDALRDIFDDFRGDLIVSPRPDNSGAVAIVSWGRIMRLDGVDVEQLEDFIGTNRNRSPEPGIR